MHKKLKTVNIILAKLLTLTTFMSHQMVKSYC